MTDAEIMLVGTSTIIGGSSANYDACGIFAADYNLTVTVPALSDKLSKLSEADIELLTLFVFDGYSQSEIAVLRHRGVNKP